MQEWASYAVFNTSKVIGTQRALVPEKFNHRAWTYRGCRYEDTALFSHWIWDSMHVSNLWGEESYCTLVLRAPCPSESLQWSGCLTSMSKASLPIGLSKLRYSFPFSLCTRGADVFLVPRVQASGRDPSADGIFYIAFGLMNSCSKLSDQAEEETWI